MNEFAQKHPVVFELVLVVVAMLAAAVGSAVLGGGGSTPELGTALGRIVVGVALLVVFRSCFDGKLFSGIVYALPILVIALWNIVYNLMSGMALSYDLFGALLLGFAPALFEEVLFRGIFIHNLKASGKEPLAVLLISAAVFGAIHLTNLAGMTVANVLVQVLYATVFGLVTGAVYLKTNDLVSIILAHAIVDMSNHLFVSTPSSTSVPMIIAFVVVLVIETTYALWLVNKD